MYETNIGKAVEAYQQYHMYLDIHDGEIVSHGWEDDDDEIYTDEYGCHHGGGIGWNPQKMWCGECSSATGPECPAYELKKGDEA